MVDTDFSYNIRKDDKSRLIVKYKEDFFGFDHVEPTNFSRDLINLKDEIFNEKELLNYLEFDNALVNSWYLKKKAKTWDELGINLQKIQFISPKYDMDDLDFYVKTINEIYPLLEPNLPTKMPIKFVDKFLDTNMIAFYLEFLKHNSIIFRRINLPKIDRKVCSCIYAHEITHIEMENAGGGITKITNGETLPIFIELLFASTIDKETKEKIFNHRLIYLAGTIGKLLKEKNLDFEKRIKLETYLISIIQGIELFNKYNEGNDKVKLEIIKSINDIFLGEILVEDILNKYDSNFLDVEPKLKVLKR